MRPLQFLLAPGAGSLAQRGLLLVAAVFLLKEAEGLLAPVLFALMLAAVLGPGVRALRRRGVPEVVGAAVLVGALLGSTVPLALALAEPAALWWKRAPVVVSTLFGQVDRWRAAIPGLGGVRRPAPTPATPADPVKERLASEGVVLTGVLLGRGARLALSTASTVILLYFLLASEHWMLSRCLAAIEDRRRRARVLGALRAIQRDLSRFLRALGLINLGVAIATALLLMWLGLPNPVLWGALCGVLNFIPYLGPLVNVGLLLLAGSTAFDSPLAMASPALAFVAVHAVESNVISPWLVGRGLSMNPLSVFLSVMFWGWLWGIAGAVLAVPMLIGLRSICRRNVRLRGLGLYLEASGSRPAQSLPTLLDRTRTG